MFCTKCGKQLADGEVCSCQQQAPQQAQPQQQQAWQQPQQQQAWQQPQQQQAWQQPQQQGWQPAGGPVTPTDNRKLFSILSYVSILWLIGLLVAPEKNDARVRFNVGQGILLTIVSAILGVVSGILQAIVGAIFTVEKTETLFGVEIPTGVYEVSGVGVAINWIIGLAVAVVTIGLMVIGIMNVVKDKDTYLPVIGKYAFYK